MVRAAPPLDGLDIKVNQEETIEDTTTTEVITTATERETEATTEESEGGSGTSVAPVDFDGGNGTTEVSIDSFIVSTTEENNEDGGEFTPAKHQQDDVAENLISNDTDQENTIESHEAARTQPQEPWMSGKERRALVSHLSDLDLESGAALVLTPRQKLALRQELEARRRGLAAWADLTPWQKLSRAEQRRFNEKYLSLPAELQVSEPGLS